MFCQQPVLKSTPPPLSRSHRQPVLPYHQASVSLSCLSDMTLYIRYSRPHPFDFPPCHWSTHVQLRAASCLAILSVLREIARQLSSEDGGVGVEGK